MIGHIISRHFVEWKWNSPSLEVTFNITCSISQLPHALVRNGKSTWKKYILWVAYIVCISLYTVHIRLRHSFTELLRACNFHLTCISASVGYQWLHSSSWANEALRKSQAPGIPWFPSLELDVHIPLRASQQGPRGSKPNERKRGILALWLLSLFVCPMLSSALHVTCHNSQAWSAYVIGLIDRMRMSMITRYLNIYCQPCSDSMVSFTCHLSFVQHLILDATWLNFHKVILFYVLQNEYTQVCKCTKFHFIYMQ